MPRPLPSDIPTVPAGSPPNSGVSPTAPTPRLGRPTGAERLSSGSLTNINPSHPPQGAFMRISCRNVFLVFLLIWLLMGCGDEQAASTTAEASAASTPTMSPSSTSKPNVQTSARVRLWRSRRLRLRNRWFNRRKRRLRPKHPSKFRPNAKDCWRAHGRV